jgi:branched-chain amino acid transport system permease protein
MNDDKTGRIPEMFRSILSSRVRLVNSVIVLLALILAFTFPLFQNKSRVGIAFVALLFAFRNSTWNIAGGYGGMLSLAHAAAFGIGAFSVAVLTWENGLNAWLSLVVGVILAGILGFVISLLMSRFGIKNVFFFALGTLAVTAAMNGLFAGWHLVGAVDGLQYKGTNQGLLHLQWFVNPVPFYYLTLFLLIILTCGVAFLVKRTHLGRSLPFIREDPIVAASMGIPVVKYRALAMALSMGLTAIPGTLIAQYVQFASYESVITVEIGVAMMVGTLIGGAGTLAGPIVAGIVIAAVNEALRSFNVSSAAVSAYTQIVYSILVILLIRFGNHGLVPLWNSFLERVLGSERRARTLAQGSGAVNEEPIPALQEGRN